MSLTNVEKSKIIADFGRSNVDSGSVEVQIALVTADINKLTGHFKSHVKDFHSRTGLIRKVNLRRTLLQYLKRKDFGRYRDIQTKLGLRGA